MNSKIQLCDPSDCTGCMACVASCKKNAINCSVNAEGFIYPQIDHGLCIGCGMCIKTCPVLTPIEKNNDGSVYAAKSKDNHILTTSSSGGIFSELALYVLSENGIVVGAKLCEDNYVRHIVVNNKTELSEIKGSKYVQSYISKDVYSSIKEALREGRKVLFCGTPCQIAGLKKIVGKYSNLLYTVDLVCHGVPSPKFFDIILQYIKKKNKNLVSYNFRDYGNWLVCSNVNININGTIKKKYLYGEATLYQDAFLKGYMHRESCYKCRYCTINRVGDITLADFWGIGKKKPIKFNVINGCSMMSVNSMNGKKLFDKIKNNIEYDKRDINETISGGNEQLIKSSTRPPERDEFYTDAFNLSFKKLIKKYKLSVKKKPSMFKSIKYRIKNLIR